VLAEVLVIGGCSSGALVKELRLELRADSAYEEPGEILCCLIGRSLCKCEVGSPGILKAIETKIVARIEIQVLMERTSRKSPPNLIE